MQRRHGRRILILMAGVFLLPAHKNGAQGAVYETVDAGSGIYGFSMPLFQLGGPLPMSFRLFHRGDQMPAQGLRHGFRHSFSFMVEETPMSPTNTFADVTLDTGDKVRFVSETGDNPWQLRDNARIRYALTETGTGIEGWYYLVDPHRGLVLVFQKTGPMEDMPFGRPACIMDRNGNRLDVAPLSTNFPQCLAPASVVDHLGRQLVFAYSNNVLQSVSDQAGRTARVLYETNAPDCGGLTVLRSIVDAAGATTTVRYAYFGPGVAMGIPAVKAVERPLGHAVYTQAFAVVTNAGKAWVRLTGRTDAYGNTMTMDYAKNTNRVTQTQPDGSVTMYEHASAYGGLLAVTDPWSNRTEFTRSVHAQPATVRDRYGRTSAMAWGETSGKLDVTTNALGQVMRLAWSAQAQVFTNPLCGEVVTQTFYNLAGVVYPDGTSETNEYDGRGNLVRRTDRAGAAWHYACNERGQITSVTNPAGGVSTYAYNTQAYTVNWSENGQTLSYTYTTNGTLAWTRDADLGTLRYYYDAAFRPVATTNVDGEGTALAYDADDRITGATNALGQGIAFNYDANGRLARSVDPLGETAAAGYDLMDRVVATTNREGETTRFLYDVMGRVRGVVLPSGGTNTFGYDLAGHLATAADPAGEESQFSSDLEGRPVSRTSSAGLRLAVGRDAVGRVTSMTNALGEAESYSLDALGRLVAVTNPAGRATHYAYDAEGRLAAVTESDGGSAAFQHNTLGLVTNLLDRNGRAWTFGYTAMGRLVRKTDPLGRTTTYTHDLYGRLHEMNRSDGVTMTLAYDAAGNLTNSAFSGGLNLSFGYDAAGRPVSGNGIDLIYDAEGRVIRSVCGGGTVTVAYAEGRPVAVGYPGGPTVTYAYDARGLVTNVADSASGAWVRFAYDADGRVAGLQRSNGQDAELTRDGAGRITRIVDGAVLDLRYTYDAAGSVTEMESAAPLSVAESLFSTNKPLAYDDASQTASAGYAHDPNGRLTNSPGGAFEWDAAGRLVRAAGAALSYDGLGALVSRAEGGVTTRYHRAYGLYGAPIVAEQDAATGTSRRYYVWTPGGELLYLVDAADGNKAYFYHGDQAGSTLALTDGAGGIADAYAYTPFGRQLAHQGTNDQPFTFLGRHGVRREGAGGALYQAGARYLDADTGRFLSPEPLWPDLAEPQSLNPYPYAWNAPSDYSDVNGLAPESPFLSDAAAQIMSEQQIAWTYALLDYEARRSPEEFIAKAQGWEQTARDDLKAAIFREEQAARGVLTYTAYRTVWEKPTPTALNKVPVRVPVQYSVKEAIAHHRSQMEHAGEMAKMYRERAKNQERYQRFWEEKRARDVERMLREWRLVEYNRSLGGGGGDLNPLSAVASPAQPLNPTAVLDENTAIQARSQADAVWNLIERIMGGGGGGGDSIRAVDWPAQQDQLSVIATEGGAGSSGDFIQAGDYE